MIQIRKSLSLKPLTTFKIGGPAREFVEIADAEDIPEALVYAESHALKTLVLGGGSNMLVSDNGFVGLVINVKNKGIAELGSGQLKVASGEYWDQVVQFAVERGLWGIENLSRIPGRTGAVAVQNVGAYGQEISQVLVSVEVYDRKKKSFRTLTKEECGFSYRKSIFNTTEKNRFVILNTTLRLSEEPHRNLTYPDVKKRFENNPEPTQQEIREAIKEIRDKKFPFPPESVEGNAGSFFKNSVLSGEQFGHLLTLFRRNLPEHVGRLHQITRTDPIAHHPLPSPVKVASAFILEACGLKGFRRGDVMLNPSQPVVVLNVTGQATADEVLSVVKQVRTIVEEKTGLHLYTEPELIGFTAEELEEYGFSEEEITRYVE
ncbi:MAG: UDP-N-acetylmuramate dehydrogenase [Bacteroidota bacterium]|nr:UDP-N-acetylmuramate dehydrogenase [Bacteroidota bacterium]MDP4233046.1 UDP-N-acetylmuramate dehydrogenase [Bacteroidota bacterium]MDP4241809.1 UDP-N-acetylmuramate dehydrogenase [Bacteroidota bacterium]MDP4288770.1 UDP-N-acetylmuramate dehydrogenase [Bacteroidota bacterium]